MNIQVHKVQKWITAPVQQTIFEYIKLNVLEKAVKKIIADRVAGWNWEIDQEEMSSVMNKKNVVVGTQTSARGWNALQLCRS